MNENSMNNKEQKTDKEWILEVSEEDYESAKAKGIEEESLFKPGKHVFRRRDPNKILQRVQTTVVLHLDEETYKYFQSRAEKSADKNIESAINAELRAVAEKEAA